MLLSACGGDGATPTPTPTPAVPVNRAPVFTSSATASVVENTTGTVYQASASDPDGDTVTYSLAGDDAARFTLAAGGQLAFVAPPAQGFPTDADRDNVYRVTIGASDGRLTTTQAVAVTVVRGKDDVDVRRIASGFATIAAIAPISDTVILVAEQGGAVHALNPQTGTRTLLIRIDNIGATGAVTALAADPRRYASDGEFFAMYRTQNGFLVVDRFLRNPAGPTVSDNVGPVLAQNAPNYAGGGWLAFDTDGTLLAATGDAGGAGDPTGSAQDDASRLGKLLRISRNPDPYAGASPVPFLLSTIAKGLHWPAGGSVTDRGILLADHGQDVAEELNLLMPGATPVNAGWPFKEGSRTVRGTPPAGVVDPVLEYFRSEGLRTGDRIVAGGRGPATIASLSGRYVFGDRSGAIYTVPIAALTPGQTLTSNAVERRDADFVPDRGTIDRLAAIIAGADGTLYIADGDGEIFRVSPAG